MEKKSKNNSKFNENFVREAWQKIKEANKITLLTHYKPDGDGIAACAALEHICLHLCKDVETIYPDNPEFAFKRQPKNVQISTHTFIPDLVIICDTANYERLYFPDDFKLIPSINIDHHVSSTINATYNFVDENAASACQILFDLIVSWNEDLMNEFLANTLLFGILYDTQIFHTQATNAATLRIAARLIEYGANMFELKTELLSNKNPKIVHLWGHILQSVHIAPSGKAVWVKITRKDLENLNITLNSLIGFNNFLSEITDVDVTLLFYETLDGKTKVSLRSKKADVNLLASRFGGGGHRNAAGILSDKNIDELIREITSLL